MLTSERRSGGAQRVWERVRRQPPAISPHVLLRELFSRRRASPRAGIAYVAELNAEGVILASSRVRLMTRRVAQPFCEDIRDLARSAGAKGLVMDLNSLATATPRAAAYAMRQLRDMSVSRVALVGGSRSTRRLASTVLTLGRFGDFRFFADCEAAISWAGPGGEDIR